MSHCSNGVEPVCFDTMTRGLRQVRRLSTLSSVLQPNFILTTEWAWFWEDEFGNWIPYASAVREKFEAMIVLIMLIHCCFYNYRFSKNYNLHFLSNQYSLSIMNTIMKSYNVSVKPNNY